MRRLAAIVLAAALSGGCFALEEIDTGMEYVEQHSDVDKKEAQAEKKRQAEAKRKQDEGPGLVERVRQWWASRQQAPAEAKETGPPPHPDNKPGRCELDGRTHFMRKFDCQLRGGEYTPLPGSGSR